MADNDAGFGQRRTIGIDTCIVDLNPCTAWLLENPRIVLTEVR